MKFIFAVFISLFSLNASAQWYARLGLVKKHERFAAIHATAPKLQVYPLFSTSYISFKNDLGRSSYSINTEEAMLMKNLQRSKHFGSDSVRVQFDNLANFYFRQNRFSEAKWYLLQSNAISRSHKDYEQIVGSLLVLADIKSNLGDFKQANEDLSEAKNIASSHSLTPDLLRIEQHSKQIKASRDGGLKIENRYSDVL